MEFLSGKYYEYSDFVLMFLYSTTVCLKIVNEVKIWGLFELLT